MGRLKGNLRPIESINFEEVIPNVVSDNFWTIDF